MVCHVAPCWAGFAACVYSIQERLNDLEDRIEELERDVQGLLLLLLVLLLQNTLIHLVLVLCTSVTPVVFVYGPIRGRPRLVVATGLSELLGDAPRRSY